MTVALTGSASADSSSNPRGTPRHRPSSRTTPAIQAPTRPLDSGSHINAQHQRRRVAPSADAVGWLSRQLQQTLNSGRLAMHRRPIRHQLHSSASRNHLAFDTQPMIPPQQGGPEAPARPSAQPDRTSACAAPHRHAFEAGIQQKHCVSGRELTVGSPAASESARNTKALGSDVSPMS